MLLRSETLHIIVKYSENRYLIILFPLRGSKIGVGLENVLGDFNFILCYVKVIRKVVSAVVKK